MSIKPHKGFRLRDTPYQPNFHPITTCTEGPKATTVFIRTRPVHRLCITAE